MIRSTTIAVGLLLALSTACRGYDYRSRISDPDGFIPGDQMARYGREQAQSVAISRAFAGAGTDRTPAARAAQALLYGLNARDPQLLAAGAFALLVVAALAAIVPAYRASRLTPTIALRDDT